MWHRASSIQAAVLVLLSAVPAAAQVEITVHGGVHMDPTGARQARERPSQPSEPGGSRSGRSLGEATTAGARLGVGLSERWQLDGGVAWSRNSSWEGTVARPLPSFESRTLFVSTTVQGWITQPGSRFGVVAGAGPALIIRHDAGTNPLHETNLGGLLSLGGVMRLDERFALRIDAQQYLFSSTFDDSYIPHLGTAPEYASRLRHDFVLLAGFSWRSD